MVLVGQPELIVFNSASGPCMPSREAVSHVSWLCVGQEPARTPVART